MVDLPRFSLRRLKEVILAKLIKKKITPTKAVTTTGKELPTVKLTIHSGDRSYSTAYETGGYWFAACSDLKNGEITQLFELSGCREGFIRKYKNCALGAENAKAPAKARTSLMVWVCKGGAKYPNNPSMVPPLENSSKERLTMTYEDWMEKSMKTAIIMLNKLEARNKWLRSKLYKVEHKLSNKHIIYYVRGSRWWQFAPHTFSLFMLLIRLAKHPSLHKLKSSDSTETIIKSIMAIKKGTDNYHASTAKYWLSLMDNRRAIYDGRDFKGNWSAFQSGSEGVRRLTDNSATDKQTQNRFNKFKSAK